MNCLINLTTSYVGRISANYQKLFNYINDDPNYVVDENLDQPT